MTGSRVTTLTGDVSGTIGCGAFAEGRYFSHVWKGPECPMAHHHGRSGLPTGWAGLAPVFFALGVWGKNWPGRTVLVRTDSKPAPVALNRVRSESPAINNLIELIFHACARYAARLVPVWQRRSHPAQQLADFLSKNKRPMFLRGAQQLYSRQFCSDRIPAPAQRAMRKSIPLSGGHQQSTLNSAARATTGPHFALSFPTGASTGGEASKYRINL